MACPVCFGTLDPIARDSMNLGIFVLLGVTLGVLGGFARFFLSLAKRGRESFFEDTLVPTPATRESVHEK